MKYLFFENSPNQRRQICLFSKWREWHWKSLPSSVGSRPWGSFRPGKKTKSWWWSPFPPAASSSSFLGRIFPSSNNGPQDMRKTASCWHNQRNEIFGFKIFSGWGNFWDRLLVRSTDWGVKWQFWVIWRIWTQKKTLNQKAKNQFPKFLTNPKSPQSLSVPTRTTSTNAFPKIPGSPKIPAQVRVTSERNRSGPTKIRVKEKGDRYDPPPNRPGYRRAPLWW